MIDIEVLENNNDDDNLISQFIEQSLNGTIYQDPKFLDYHTPDKFSRLEFQVKNLVFKKKNKIIAFLPGRIHQEKHDVLSYKSPFASSYGGYVFHPKIKFSEIEEVLDAAEDVFKSMNISRIEMTPSLICYGINKQGEKLNYLEYILLKKKYKIDQIDLCLVHKTDHKIDLKSRFNSKIRTELKQCFKKELKLTIIDEVDGELYELLLSSQRSMGKQPTHSLIELKEITIRFPDKIKSFKSYLNGELIGGIICIIISEKVLNTFYIFDSRKHREYKPNHFNYYNVLNWATENNFEYVDFGPTTFGFEPHYPLIFYKEKFDTLPFSRKKFVKILKDKA